MNNSNEVLETFLNDLLNHHFIKAIETLKKLGTGSRNTPKTPVKRKAINYVISNVKDQIRLKDIAIQLAMVKDVTGREIATSLLSTVYHEDPSQTSNILRTLANDENWEVREWAAGACGHVLTNHFDQFYKDIRNWTNDHSGNVRRAAVLAAMYAENEEKRNSVNRY
ncbi:HEAT repeat domain-containing protein [Salinibacillus kushneri]|nr:HEAT repeat domain-containing protein [Salinibacillus kushneri]